MLGSGITHFYITGLTMVSGGSPSSTVLGCMPSIHLLWICSPSTGSNWSGTLWSTACLGPRLCAGTNGPVMGEVWCWFGMKQGVYVQRVCVCWHVARRFVNWVKSETQWWNCERGWTCWFAELLIRIFWSKHTSMYLRVTTQRRDSSKSWQQTYFAQHLWHGFILGVYGEPVLHKH